MAIDDAHFTQRFDTLPRNGYEPRVGLIGRRHVGHLTVLVAEHHGVHVMMADLAGDDDVADLQPLTEATGRPGVDHCLGPVHVKQQGRAHGSIHLADA